MFWCGALMSMTVSLRATSTTLVASHGVNVTISEEIESVSSAAYVIGVVLFGLIFTCGFVLTCCQVRGNGSSDQFLKKVTLSGACKEADSATTPKLPPSNAASTSSQVLQQLELGSGDLGQMVTSHTCNASAPLTPVELPVSRGRLPLQAAGGCPMMSEPHVCFPLNPTSGQLRPATHASPSLRAAAYSDRDKPRRHDNRLGEDCSALGSWVGSSDWASARASRKRQVQGVARPPCRKNPAFPSLPPPTLDVPDQIPAGLENDASWANRRVSDHLRSTAGEHMSLRRKTFKGLCARWHPDKNFSGNTELATEVFQYLQAQKAWYLGDKASLKTRPHISVC